MITAADVWDQFSYDPLTGDLVRIKTGRTVGTSNGKYLQVRVNGRLMHVHKVIWTWMTGIWPGDQVDHVNRNKLDNRWFNLRAATVQQNRWNRKARGYFPTPNGTYQSQIKVDGRFVHLGTFATPEEAKEAFDKASRHHRGDWYSAK
jgi:hypothetical protein